MATLLTPLGFLWSKPGCPPWKHLPLHTCYPTSCARLPLKQRVRGQGTTLKRMTAIVVVAQLLRCVQLFVTPWTTVHQPSLSFTISQNLHRLVSIESIMPSYHLILCHPLLLPSIFPSIGVFSNELTFRIRWPKDWNFSFSTISSNEYSVLISFRIDMTKTS